MTVYLGRYTGDRQPSTLDLPMGQFFFTLLTACITAPLAAGLTARFALHRFYAEKQWERKVAAYTAIFDALHDITKWFSEHQLGTCQ